MREAWGSKVPLTARAVIAQRVRAGTPVRDLAREYRIHKTRVHQILRQHGISGSAAQDRQEPLGADETWVNARLAIYEDDETRAWVAARLRAFLARWHRRHG